MDIRKRFQLTKRNTALSNYYYSIRQENEYRNALNKIAEDRAKLKIEDEKRNLLKKLKEEKKKEEEATQAKKNIELQRLYVTVPSQDLPASRIPSKGAGRKLRTNVDRSTFDKWLHTDQIWEPVKKQLGDINFNIHPNPETGSWMETNMQRQITRSNLQKKGNELTEEEKDYYRTTSPEFIDEAAKLWEAFKRNQENEEDLKDFATGMKIMESIRYGVQPTANPVDYTSSLIAGKGSIDPNSIAGQALLAAQDYNAINKHLDDPSYVKDAYSKYQQDRLLAEIGAQGGIITRNKENALRTDRIQQFADLTNEYIDVYNRLGQLPIGRRQERSQLINRLSQIEAQRAKLTPLIKQDVSYDLGGNETSNVFNAAYGVVLSRNQYESMSISGLGKMLLQYDLSDPNTDRDTVKKLISALSVNNKRYKQQLGVENKNALAEGNLKYKELEQYRKWHMPSKDFLEKAQAAQENKLSDIDTYLYSMPGTLGSSASYWKTQAVATGLMFTGSALVQSKSAATAATGLGLIATGAGIQFLSGANENNAEVSSNWQNGFLNELVVKGLFDKFIKDGRHKLAKKGINAPTDQDVLDNYTLGNFKSDNDLVESIAEKYIYGANNLFKQDMMATTADVAFSAGLSIFAPGSKYAKFIKFKPIGTDRTSALSRLYRMKGASEGAANKMAAAITGATSESTTAGILRTIASPLEYAYRGVKGGVAASSSRAAGLILKLDSRIAALADWAKAVPAKLLAKDAAEVGKAAALRSVKHAANAGTVGRHVLQFAERQAAQAMSEGIEEGKQYENGERYANREYAGSSRSMARVLIDDISTGVNVGFQFLGNQFGIFDADKDLMANMRGGFLGGLMNLQNGVSVAVSDVRGTIRDVSANDFLYQNLLAEKYGGRSTIENGRQFARYANRQPEMSEAFDRFQSIMDVQASKGEAAFTKEDIDEQRNQFNRISKIVNNRGFREIAKNRGIKFNSNEFNTLASIYNWADQNLYENVQALKAALEEQKKLGYHSKFEVDLSAIDSAIEHIFGVDSSLSEREQRLVNEAEDVVRTEYLKKYHRDPTDDELEKGVRNVLQRHNSWNNSKDLAVMRYYALQQLIQNLDRLKNNPSTKNEFEKHRTKYKYYKKQLDNLRNGLFKEDINRIDSSTDSFSAARRFVENDDMFDNVVDSVRQIIQLESQVNDSASIISDLFGISIAAVNKTYRENLLSGVIDSQYARSAMNNEEISDELTNLTATLDGFSHGVKALDKKDRKAKRKNLVSQYLNGVTQDEEFAERINRDFRQYHEAQEEKAEFIERTRKKGIYMTENNALEEESAEYDYTLLEEAKRRRDDFLETIKDDKKRDRTLVDLSSDEQIALAEEVYSNGYTVRDIENDDFTYNGQIIPVGDNIVKVAECPDGSLIPLTQGLVDYINHLNNVNDLLEESVIETSSTPNLQHGKIDSIKDYEDQILDAILNNDRETFDKLTSLISPFVDEDYMKMLNDMWNETIVAQAPTEQRETDITIAINDVLSKFNTIIALVTKYNNIVQEVLASKSLALSSTFRHTHTNKDLKSLNENVGGMTRGQKVQIFVKAGFKFEDRPKTKTTWYYAVSPQGDEYRISKLEYEFANFILNLSSTDNAQKKSYTAPFSSTGYNIYAEGFKENYVQRNYTPIEPTRWHKLQPKTNPDEDVLTTLAQRNTLSTIEAFQSDNMRNVRKDLTTGMDYFIVIDGKLTRISRVHSYLHPQYDWGQKETQDYENRRKQLYDLADKGDISGLKKLIVQWQTEVNQYILNRYGKDSLEYKQFAINLLPYVNCGNAIMLDRESLDHVASITHYKMNRSRRMVPSCVINRSVIGGTIIDDLCRRFFAGETVEYSDNLMMSKETFDALIKQLTAQRDLFKNRGWVISTTPYTWHGRLADGRLVAGETDMVAVDKDGHIHIIDFKTSKRSFDQLQYKNTTELGGVQWEDVIDGVDYTGKEVRHVSHALDDKIGTQKLTAREHYAEQQTHYLNMIRQCLGDRMADGIIVDDASLLVFLVRTKAVVMPNETLADVNAFGGFVDSGLSTLVHNDDQILNDNKAGVVLQGVIELSFDENVSKLYNKLQDEDLSDMLAAMDEASEQLDLHAAQLVSLYNENKDKLSDVLKKRVRDLAKSARSIPVDAQDPKVREDKLSILNKYAQIVEAIRKTDELIEDIRKELEQQDDIQRSEVPQGHKLNPNLKTATGELANFDHLNFENPKIAVHPDLKRCSAYPDFLEHAVFEVDMSSLGSWFSVPNAVDCSVFVNIYYDEHLPNGQIVHHEWKSKNGRGIKLIPTLKSTNINTTDSQLIRKINQLIHDPQNAGKRIVLTGASRTNGRIVYSEDSLDKGIKDAFNLSDSDLETLQTESAEGHQIGIVKGGGVAELQPASGNVKYVYSVNPNRRDAITGDLGALTDGVVTLIYNCGYNEDGGSRAHSIPIALTPMHLTDNDIAFIVSLLKNYKNRVSVTINGKRYASPISNSRLLRTLVRFGQGAEQTNSRFIFGWANTDKNGFSTDNYRTVRIALIDQKLPTNPDGSTNYKFDYVVDLTDEQAVKSVLIPALKQNVYLYANNEQAMLHASVSSRDESNKHLDNAPMTNPFVGLEQFIKDNPELTEGNEDWEIKFSDSLIFRRSDVDPDLDGSYKGITGLHWMIKNGWLRTNFDHIELPLIAFTDARVEENPNHPKNIDDQPAGPTTAVSEEPKQDNSPAQPRKRRRRKIDTSMIDDNGIEGMLEPKMRGKEEISRNTLNEERARKRIRKILGKSFKVVVDSLERVGMNANEALGLIGSDQTAIAYASKDAITLSDAVGNGEEFHEAFHIVLDLLVGEKRRKGIYERYKKNYFKKYGKHLSESQISENLADEYYNFRTKQYFKPSWNIIGSIFNAVTDWCQFLRNLGDYKLALVFVEANLGRYRIKSADPESIKSWEVRNKNKGNIEPYTITLNNEKVDLKYFKSGREFDDAVNSILYQIMKAYGIDQLGQNADKLQSDVRFLKDKDSLLYKVYLGLTQAEDEDGEITDQDIIDMRDDGEITVLQATNILKYREVFLHWNDALRMINDKLRAMGVYSKRDRLEAEKEDNDAGEGTDAGQDIKDHSDEFYTHARSEEIDAGIRYFLSTVPSVRWATQEDVDNGIVPSLYKTDRNGKQIVGKDGKPVKAVVPLAINSMGTVQFMPFNTVYQTLLKQLYDVKNVRDLLKKADNLGESDYLFYYVKKSFRSYLSKSYIRYGSKEDEKAYAGIPKVRYKDGYLNPNDYVVDLNNPTDEELNPDVVRWTHDVVENGIVIARKGDIIQTAEIITNPKFESVTTQLYQAIKSQHLNYNFTYAYPVRDEHGRDTGLRHYKEYGANSQRDSYAYPILWFNLVRSTDDLFIRNDSGNYVVNKDSQLKKSLNQFKDFLYILKTGMAVNRRSRISIDGQTYNFDNDEDFNKIETLFIEKLNSVGIQISRYVLDHLLISQITNSQRKQDVFENILTSQGNDSLAPFIDKNGILDKMIQAIDRGDVNFFMQDTNTRTTRTGSYLYSKSGFVISLAKALSDYKLLSSETMVVGPQNAKMYTFAQNHTASDITDDINTTYDENGNIRKGSTMDDMKDVEYVVSTDEDGSMIGSVITKEVLKGPLHNRLKLHTYSGVRDTTNNDGGTKYSEITAREDTLAKMNLLSDGAIIFPTLSDKSTYMYLTGIPLPGFDYHNGVNFAQLPKFKKNDRIFYQRSDRKNNVAGDDVSYYYPNSVLDQIIEYALCEFKNVQKTIKALHLDPNDTSDASIQDSQKVQNYYTGPSKSDAGYHGARFAFLSGIYDENGIYVSFNRYEKDETDGGVMSSYQLAVNAFFSKSKEEQRAIIQRTLLRRLDELLADLVEKGIIYRVEENTTYHLEDGRRVKSQHSKYLGYANRYLDNSKIEYLANIYYANSNGKWNMDQCRSMAIVAYAQDVNNKSIMSLEEVERLFTGMPQFFKWKYNTDGDLIDRGEDESKRFGGLGSTGVNNRDDLPNLSEEYTCAEINDQYIESSLSATLTAAFEEGEYREALVNKKVRKARIYHKDTDDVLNAIYDEVYSDKKSLDDIKNEFTEAERAIIDRKIKAEAKSYTGGINVADGTAYITDTMCENLLRQRGVFTKEVAEAFQYLRNQKAYERTKFDKNKKKVSSKFHEKNGYMTNAKAYRIIMEAQISTLKYSAFGYRMENGIPVHFYNKFALFPLFEGISYGFTRTLYEKMTDKENPVDMVMFNSAVKAGSEGSQAFNPEMENPEEFSFVGRIYKQRYKYIRRLLNTDPKAIGDMAMGTQAVKVAFAALRDNQTYTTEKGQTIRGSDLKKAIMHYITGLAAIGQCRVFEKFFDNRGDIDIRKFSDFVKKELMSRNANKNLLDALDVVSNSDGTIQFKTALDTVSDMSWIESIINSYINKEIIDITLPGNAFYLRSIFGMEGITKLYEDDATAAAKGFNYTINNGNELQMVNEQGSMDCVVSIDFFTEMKDGDGNFIVPREICDNFLKTRLWLIDQGVIGGAEYNEDGTLKKEGAKTLIMSYRIPTQAASSINPLRVVDVLPVIRDTIVLPKEFTALTGSDFDIDKLYLSTYYFRNKNGKMSRDFTEIPKEHFANQLLNLYFTLLEDCGRQVNKGELSKARYAQYLRRSIDNDTALVDSVLAKIRANDIHPIYESMQYGALSTQTNIKDQFITGKKGIGPFALNNNSQILTQLFKVAFNKEDGLLSDLNLNSLHDYVDRDGNSIQSWLSAMINIHVDVAKDPKVRPLNINQYTYNLLNLLLRIGLGQDSLYFITQPVVRELAETSNQNNGYIVENPGLSKSQRQKSAEAMLLFNTHFQDSDINEAIDMINRRYLPSDLRPKLNGEKYSDRVKSIFDRYRPLIRQLFMINKDGEYHRTFKKLVDGKWQEIEGVSIFEDIMTSSDVLIDPNAPRSISNLKTQPLYKINDEYLSPNDVQGLVYIAKVELDKYAQTLSNLVKYTKIDTKKQGKNINEQSKYRKAYLAMRDSLGDGYFNSNLLRMLDDSFINEKTMMGTSMLLDVLASRVIRATDVFNNTVDDIARDMNQYSDASLAAIRKGVMAAIKQKAMNYVMDMNDVQWMDMITGPNTLSVRIQKLRSKILADPKTYSDFVTNGNISNRLLDAIRPVPYTPAYGSVRYDMLTLDNIESDDTCTQNDYIDAWQQLLDSEDEEIRQIGSDLAIYAFMTSADTAGSTKFFKYVPISWRIDFGYDSAISAAYDEYANPHMRHERTFRINIDDFIKDNWLNNAIVPLTQLMVARPATQEEILNGYTNTGIIYELNFVSVNLKYKDVNRAPGHEGEFVEQQIPYMIAGVKYGYSYARATISPNSEGSFPTYIKLRRQGASYQDTDAYLLYRLVKVASRIVIDKNSKMREVKYPIYLLDRPSGARIYALGLTFLFYGYGRGSEYSHLPEIEHPTEKDFLNLENVLRLDPQNSDELADLESYDEWISGIIDGGNSNFVGDAVKVMKDIKDDNDSKLTKSSGDKDVQFYHEATSTEDSQRLESYAKQMLDDAELGSLRKDAIKNIFGSETPYREEPYKASQLLQNIINTTQHPSVKKIAELLLSLSKGDNDFDIVVREHLGEYNASGEAYQSTNKFGSYININFLTPAFLEHPEHVILHEIVHLNTLALMKSDKMLYNAIQDYMNYVRDHLSESQKSKFQYALLDPFEFVAEVYSRPMLQAALKKIPAMEKNKFANMFDQIIDAVKLAIRRILNKNEYPASALDQIMPVINSIMATQYSADNNMTTFVERNTQTDSRLAESMSANNTAVANEIAQIIQDDRNAQRSEYAQYYKDVEQMFYDMMSELNNVDLYDMSPQMMPLSTTQLRKAVANRLNNRWKDDIYRNWNSIDKGWESYNDFKNGTVAEENRSQLLYNILQNMANSLSKVGIKVSITYNSNNGYKISSTTNSDIVSGKNADTIYNMLYQQLTKNHPWYSINPQAKSQININLRSKSWFDELVKERQNREEEENTMMAEDVRESLLNMYRDGLIEQIKDMAPFGYNYSDEEINNMSYEEIAEKLFGC